MDMTDRDGWNKQALLMIGAVVNPSLSITAADEHSNERLKSYHGVWQPEKLLQIRALLIVPVLKRLPILAAKTHSYFSGFSSTLAIERTRLFGDLRHSQHMFHSASLDWNIKLHEAQITQAISYFLSTDQRICNAFIAALSVNQPRPCGMLSFQSTDEYQVDAEVRVDKKHKGQQGFIDLLISWVSDDDKRNAMVIEFKLEHSITRGQLGKYRSHAQEKYDCFELCLVTKRGLDAKSRRVLSHSRNKDWNHLYWDNLLRAWERELTATGLALPDDFNRFRRTLWDRVFW